MNTGLIEQLMAEAEEILAECRREADYDPGDGEHDDAAFMRYVDRLEGLAGALAIQRRVAQGS